MMKKKISTAAGIYLFMCVQKKKKKRECTILLFSLSLSLLTHTHPPAHTHTHTHTHIHTNNEGEGNVTESLCVGPRESTEFSNQIHSHELNNKTIQIHLQTATNLPIQLTYPNNGEN